MKMILDGSPHGNSTPPALSVVPARRFVPGQEYEFLEAIERFMFLSMRLLTQNVAAVANVASNLLRKRVYKTRSDDKTNNRTLHRGNSEDFTAGELDGIVDSMSYVLEVMEHYKSTVSKVAANLMPIPSTNDDKDKSLGLEVTHKTDESCGFNAALLQETTPADLLLGALMPMNSIDEYPEGSTPINANMPSCGPTADAFIGSLSALLNGESKESEDKRLSAKLSLLNNIDSVSAACTMQVDELDTVLSITLSESLDSSISGASSVMTKKTGNGKMSRIFTKRSSRKSKPNTTSYLQQARVKVSEYAALAKSVMEDEIKCVVSQYACGNEKESPPPCFRPLQEHFMSSAYDLDFRTYINTESDDPMKQMLLESIHASPFLKNVGTHCQPEVRKQVGQELSRYLCDSIMESLQSGPGGRITEWGALLLGRHVRALHAYVYEFSRWTGSTDDLLLKVKASSMKVPLMSQKWKDIFEVINIVALEELRDLRTHRFEAALSPQLVYTILNLRSEFPEDQINGVIRETFLVT